MRLDVRSQLKYVITQSPNCKVCHTDIGCLRNHDGTLIAMYYKGTVALTAGVQAVLSGSADAKTTDYGKKSHEYEEI